MNFAMDEKLMIMQGLDDIENQYDFFSSFAEPKRSTQKDKRNTHDSQFEDSLLLSARSTYDMLNMPKVEQTSDDIADSFVEPKSLTNNDNMAIKVAVGLFAILLFVMWLFQNYS